MPLSVFHNKPEPASDQSKLSFAAELSQEVPSKAKSFSHRILGWVVAGLSCFVLGFAGVWFWLDATELISPLGKPSSILGFRQTLNKPTKIVYGYLPYWNFKYRDDLNFESLTHLALFGLSFNADGSIKVREQDYTEPGWRNLTSQTAEEIIVQAKQQQTQVTITLTAFDNQNIQAIVSNPEATQQLILETIEYIQRYDLDGVNIDFEYVGTPSEKTRTDFTQFTATLNQQIKQLDPYLHVSVAVYADSADNNRLWEIDKLAEHVDHIIIMAYDFYRPSSETAGPVAPMFGAGNLWSQDIVTLTAKHMEVNSSEKLLLGVPFYGYEWPTADDAYLSPRIARGGTSSYRRTLEIIDQQEVTKQWNNQALSPWLSYTKDETVYQIYYDDPQSLSFKYDLVNQTDMGGIAIWALGYEGDGQDMWKTIQRKF